MMSGFTVMEKLRSWRWHKDGWDNRLICLRINQDRQTPPLAKHGFPKTTIREVTNMLSQFKTDTTI